MTNVIDCPVCDGDLVKSDIPREDIYYCKSCKELLQIVDGNVSMLSGMLQRNAMGDDRVHAAMSQPHIASIVSFMETFENATRMWQMDLAAASGGLRTILAQIENRIDFAINTFAGLAMASDEAGEGLSMLREARELVSTLPSRNRGIQEPKMEKYGTNRIEVQQKEELKSVEGQLSKLSQNLEKTADQTSQISVLEKRASELKGAIAQH